MPDHNGSPRLFIAAASGNNIANVPPILELGEPGRGDAVLWLDFAFDDYAIDAAATAQAHDECGAAKPAEEVAAEMAEPSRFKPVGYKRAGELAGTEVEK